MIKEPSDFEAVVVGAGPAGIAVVGVLLERGITPIFWVDDEFNGGRVNKCYREVPSNTRVGLLLDFAAAVAPFRQILDTAPPGAQQTNTGNTSMHVIKPTSDAVHALQQLDPEKTCPLSYAADMLLVLTKGLRDGLRVQSYVGIVSSASLDQQSSLWTIRMCAEAQPANDDRIIRTKKLVLCTGAVPYCPPMIHANPSLQPLPLDLALSPKRLQDYFLASLGPTTVAVIGASHSAILVLMNLSKLASTSGPCLKIKWLARRELVYAEYENGFIARDNTGLKGEAALWARRNLEPDTFLASPVSRFITKIRYTKQNETQIYGQHLANVELVVQAVGYVPSPIPKLTLACGEKITADFDHGTGRFTYDRSNGRTAFGTHPEVPGLYGAGIAFPQRVRDRKYGHWEMNVGFFGFVKAFQQWMNNEI